LKGRLHIRQAKQDDIADILRLLRDDDLAKLHEDEANTAHKAAFSAIATDHNQCLVVGELSDQIAATLQITFIPGLSRSGMWRAQIEGVRIARHLRGQGYGQQLLSWALSECRARSCGLVQLLMDDRREAAAHFYEGLGFKPSHRGYRLYL
jgi:GNAT superfamily N-acetyltransferase